MPLYYDSFKNSPLEGFNGDLNIEGLEIFKRSLERHFFSRVTVRNCSLVKTSVLLAIELDCELSLVEMLFHFNKGTWGNFQLGKSSFAKLLRQLVTENDVHVDAEEITFTFKDTTIVINKIYKNSIAEQLENIFMQIGKHYVHFSKGLMETPYEIYIPVFEESTHANDTLLRNIEAANHSKKDYFKYWGLYCESEEDAVIYDLKNSRIEKGDLFMLNH